MCLTIPVQVLEVHKTFVLVKENEKVRRINSGFLNSIRKDDWILHTVGTAVRKIDCDEAEEIIDLLKKTAYFPKKTSLEFQRIIKQAQKREDISKESLKYLLEVEGDEKGTLFSEANLTRQASLRDFFCIHGIIEFSNYCKNDCLYCGLRSENNNLKRYRMSVDEIVKTAIGAVKKGYKLLVLQSGEDYFYTDKMLVDIINKIKRKSRVFIFISVGERGFQAYQRMKKAGASGVLFRFETSNPILFRRLHPRGKSFKNRLKHLEFFKKLGYFIATGSMIGLPDQDIDDLVEDILLTKKWANMVSMGPFLPTVNTPLDNTNNDKTKKWKIDMNLRMIAVLRLLLPKVRIPVVTALETLAGVDIRKKTLQSGANSLMFNLTPPKYRPHYKIYNDKFYQKENVWEKYGLFEDMESYKMLEERMSRELNV